MFMHGKGYQMMRFRSGLWNFSTRQRDVTKQHMYVSNDWERYQFAANCCVDVADLATVVSQAHGIKFYGATAYHSQRFSCCLEPHNPYDSNYINLMLSKYRMLGALGVLNSFSLHSALEKEDLLDRLGSKLVISANNLTDFAFAYCC